MIFIQLGPRFPFLRLRKDEESRVQVGGWVGLCPEKTNLSCLNTFNVGGSQGGHLNNTLVPVLLLEVGATCVRQEAAEEGGGGGGGGKGAGGGGQEGTWLGWRELQVSVQLKELIRKFGHGEGEGGGGQGGSWVGCSSKCQCRQRR